MKRKTRKKLELVIEMMAGLVFMYGLITIFMDSPQIPNFVIFLGAACISLMKFRYFLKARKIKNKYQIKRRVDEYYYGARAANWAFLAVYWLIYNPENMAIMAISVFLLIGMIITMFQMFKHLRPSRIKFKS